MISPPPVLKVVVHWSARILSALILLFWGFFLAAHIFGDAGRASRPLTVEDYVALTMMGAWLVGLALAWKWELAGGAVTLAAVFICAVVNWRVLTFPGTLIPIAGALFLVSWWLREPGRASEIAQSSSSQRH